MGVGYNHRHKDSCATIQALFSTHSPMLQQQMSICGAVECHALQPQHQSRHLRFPTVRIYFGRCRWESKLVGFYTTTNLIVWPSIDWYKSGITSPLDTSRPATCSFGMPSDLPAIGTVGVGVCHVKVCRPSPASCTTTCVHMKAVYVLRLTGQTFLQPIVYFFKLCLDIVMPNVQLN